MLNNVEDSHNSSALCFAPSIDRASIHFLDALKGINAD
jgi:hypothetical protein